MQKPAAEMQGIYIVHVPKPAMDLAARDGSASTSPEIQEFSGILGIFKDRKSTFRELKKKFRN